MYFDKDWARVPGQVVSSGHYGLNWKTVKALDKAQLTHELGPVALDDLQVIGLD